MGTLVTCHENRVGHTYIATARTTTIPITGVESKRVCATTVQSCSS